MYALASTSALVLAILTESIIKPLEIVALLLEILAAATIPVLVNALPSSSVFNVV